jgi:hypothetical protein
MTKAERPETGGERNWRISWEVACELSEGIGNGRIIPIRMEPDRQGRPIGLLCTICISDLLDLARSRGDAGDIVSSLVTWYSRGTAATNIEMEYLGAQVAPETMPAPRRRWPRDPEDEARTAEGCKMVRSGEARSANAAAKIIAERVGGHSKDATRDRLARSIRSELKLPISSQ